MDVYGSGHLRKYSGVCLEGLRETTKTLDQSRSRGHFTFGVVVHTCAVMYFMEPEKQTTQTN
jgi:hypothetical protein